MKCNFIVILMGIYLGSLFITGCNTDSKKAQTYIITDSLKDQCVYVLQNVMQTQSKWVKVHAAEYLIWTDHPDSVWETFLAEEQLHGAESPYRIGIWRVLAQAANNEKTKDKWISRIQNAFLNINGHDRIWAAETMAKLDIVPAPNHPEVVWRAIKSSNPSLSLYTLWAASNINSDSLQQCKNKLLHLLASDRADFSQKRLAAYILRHIDNLDASEWKMLAAKAAAKPDTSLAKAYMLSAAYITAPHASIQSDLYKKIKTELIAEAKSPRAGNRTELAAALAEKGTVQDLPVLISMLNNKYPLKKESDNADAKAAAAYAILMIGK